MSATVSSFPIGFSWLSPASRPTDKEVSEYATLIAEKESAPPYEIDRYWREAELQIWATRSGSKTKRPRKPQH